MVDLFMYRDPEEAEKQAEAAADLGDEGVATFGETTMETGFGGTADKVAEWGATEPEAAFGQTAVAADGGWGGQQTAQIGDWNAASTGAATGWDGAQQTP